ncbi:hypothetical protein MJO28_002398 [Puccinia striiformis f. sp. tritici]|uniref:Uncharacterized protein n=1 Tax=Puccinia striiformis f. sp. tritici TaxID=168172 RepID=A0ACC0EQ64_9BASI|nr:hypothetical protein MJO28_002398 [Puccinia striiformis f. sp. tritici]
MKRRDIEESYQNSSTNLHRSTSSNPTTSRSQLPFQRNSATRSLASSVIPTTRSTNVSSIPTASLSQHEHFQNVIKIKRRKTEETNFPKKKSTPSSSKAAKSTDNDRLIDCGFVLYVNDELNEKTGIFNVTQLVNLNNPNLFDDLMDTLWELFVHELSSKSILSELRASFSDYVYLMQGTSRITNQDALIYITRKSTHTKPARIDIIYQHETSSTTIKDSTEGIDTSSEESNTSIKVATRSCRKKSNVIAPSYSRPKASTSKSTVKKCESSDSIDLSSDECVIFSKPSTRSSVKQLSAKSRGNKSSQSNSERNTPASSSIPSCHLGTAKGSTWASGGIACTMPQKSNTGLSTQLRVLGKKNNDCITIETEGWINAHRLIFNTLNRAEHKDLKANIQPITIRVNEKNIIGEGSMRRAFKAEVKTICSDGLAIITNHVAKIQYHEKYQTIAHHATDALMYEASGLLLSKFKCLISESSRVDHQYKKIANTLQIVRYAVVVIGSCTTVPNQVYFLEAALDGPYVKYSSNVDFNIQENEPGIDLRTYWLMNALSHWTYVQSNGKSLLCDLQGVGPILTDPQILDTDPTRWANGNSGEEGITKFVEQHTCNEICKALQFQSPRKQLSRDQSHLPSCSQPSRLSASVRPNNSIGGISLSAKHTPGSIRIQPTPHAKSSLAHIIHCAEGEAV